MCNCNNNPCSCPNADCNCPPDYSIAPAMINCSGTTCEDTMETACIFTSNYLNCSRIPIGTSLDATLQILDAKICSCGSCTGVTANTSTTSYDGSGLPCIGVSGTTDLNTILLDIDTKLCSIGNSLEVYYVDSNNTQSGNGSVINPFKTMEQAYNKIIGTGTVSNPQNPNVAVSVAGGSYSTVLNIYIPGITWNFATNATVAFNGNGTYFIDASIVNSGVEQFEVAGDMQFTTSLGGFLNNKGGTLDAGVSKQIIITCLSIVSTSTLPLIVSNQTDAINRGQLYTTIKITQSGGNITSTNAHVFSSNGGFLDVDLQGCTVSCGAGGVGGQSSNIINYTGTNNGDSYASGSHFSIKDGYFTGANISSMISFSGSFNYFLVKNIITLNSGNSLAKPSSFLTIGNSQTATTHNLTTFLLEDILLRVDSFSLSGSTTNIINYTGSSTFANLQMQNCNIPSALVLGPNISLGGSVNGSSVACINILNGLLTAIQIPEYANQSDATSHGLTAGNIYQQTSSGSPTGQLMIVY